MESPVAYRDIESVHIVSGDPQEPLERHCLRLQLKDDTQLLIQTPHAYGRNQWMHSINWRVRVAPRVDCGARKARERSCSAPSRTIAS